MVFLLGHRTFIPLLYSSSNPFLLKPKPLKPMRRASITIGATIPARDRVIDFGKYKGKMLGTLPSNYLTWISKNLRARDFEEWANLADEVLKDPLYRDRLEWESAEKILKGNVLGSESRSAQRPVSDLLEISERFGWDNEDTEGWRKIHFGLLGTSKSGRIPRVAEKKRERKSGSERDGRRGRRRGGGRENEGGEVGVGGKREERRERRRLQRSGEMNMDKRLGNEAEEVERLRYGPRKDGRRCDDDRTVEVNSPFPGREALLRRVLGGDKRSTL
ncbi:hypothetical protein Nepgr_019389 [Nepenthes gracilis]|uniref:Uncharacterized protein n=1 Tax=Nepenthes gracilis TaxID=150966 RepID=A0AAD3XUB8_NEPGR|nr:hypothetical protein Nepgr_019389 [Nepenthes gracilis]